MDKREITGRISSIQTMGTLDGPGVRFVAFLQGCPLRCIYCHNPETWESKGGRRMSAQVLVDEALKYRAYITPGGGVTLSGGEPLRQPAFVAEVMRLCHEAGLHVAVDTAGSEQSGALEALESCDLVLLDVKFLSEEGYRRYTGGSFATVLRTLSYLNQRKIPTWVRQVIVPGINDTEENVSALKELVSGYDCVEKIELLPFSRLCLSKYEQMSLDFPLKDTPACPPETISRLRSLLYG